MQQAQRAWVAEPGRLERSLIALAIARSGIVECVVRALRIGLATVMRQRAVQILVWTLTLRLPGEIGYSLRARRRRGAGRGFGRARIALNRSARPAVSIVIPSFGKVPLTLRCLGAIAADPPVAPIEVIVADDCSGDPALGRLRRVRGLRFVSTPRNLGFIGAANHAAALARGELVLFLNNDAFVRPGAIDAMLATLRDRADAGAVGAKLLFPDGTLQEAGGIIWRDGTGWNYGRGDDPARPVYNYLRAADYCSAAALMIRRNLFEAMGGFDAHFAPAYYEDADFAFRLRALGYLTLYQPLAEVVHVEGASNGTDLRRGVKAHQEINRERFVARWQDELEREHLPPGGSALRARDRSARRRVALVLEHRPPEPDRDGGSQNLAAIIAALRDAGLVVKLWVETIREQAYARALQQDGVEVAAGDVGDFETWIAEHGGALDLVLINRPHVAAAYLGAVRRYSAAQVAYNGVDLHGQRMAMQAQLRGDGALADRARETERLERWIWRSVDVALYLSEDEARTARALEPAARIAAIAPFCFASFPEPRRPPAAPEMLFVGGFAHCPNEDAMLWFAAEVLPLILERAPGARLIIAGSEIPDSVQALASDTVSVMPDVTADELRTLYARARVSVAPLRFGAGVKLKVAEALREGTPVVTTSVGAQGLPALQEIACVADGAGEFAGRVAALLEDDALWAACSAAQIGYAERHFNRKRFARALLGALELPRAPPVAKPARKAAPAVARLRPAVRAASDPQRVVAAQAG